MRIRYQPRRTELGFETYVAPDSFDRTAQPVDIYEVFKAYFAVNNQALYIYSVANTTNLVMELKGGTSYRFGSESGGIQYTNDVDFSGKTELTSAIVAGNAYSAISVTTTEGFPASGIICIESNNYYVYREYFTYTSKDSTNFYGSSTTFVRPHDAGKNVYYCIQWTSSTKRWVIVNNTTLSRQICYMAAITGPEWLYCGPKINSIFTGDTSAEAGTIKWIHCDDLSNITEYAYCCHYGNSNLNGTLYISDSATKIGVHGISYDFGLCFRLCTNILKVIIPENITWIGPLVFDYCIGVLRYDFYPSAAPVVVNPAFGSFARDLHIKSGSSGYDVSPWTDTAIFGSIIADL
jgi:hypothetical protein